MASLGNALFSALSHTKAEEAFRPGWDRFEDFLVYGLIILGLIVLPTAIINGTPLDCTLCHNAICTNKTMMDEMPKNEDGSVEDPGFHAWWTKKFCTFNNSVDPFILYFPYFLLIVPLIILLIERLFMTIFKSGLKLDAFYNLLVNEALLEGSGTEELGNKEITTKYRDSNNSKLALEVAQTLWHSSSYFYSYLFRTVFEFIVALVLLIWLILRGLPVIDDEKFIYCHIKPYYYHCAGHPQQFYLVVCLVTIVMVFLYLSCCIFNILWMFIPQFGSLSGAMQKIKQEYSKTRSTTDLSDRELLGDLYDFYYNSRDMKLLLDLLAATSGIAPCLKLLCMFDRNLRKMTEVSNLTIDSYYNSEKDRTEAVVKFDDAPALKDIFVKIRDVQCIYSVVINPPINKGSVHALKSDHPSIFTPRKSRIENPIGNGSGDVEMVEIESQRNKTKFKGIDSQIEYTFVVSTLINGKTISKKVHTLKPTEEVNAKND